MYHNLSKLLLLYTSNKEELADCRPNPDSNHALLLFPKKQKLAGLNLFLRKREFHIMASRFSVVGIYNHLHRRPAIIMWT